MIENITTYSELADLAEDWAARFYPLVVVIGRPGTGKTSTFLAAAGQEAIVINGRVSGAALFTTLEERPDAPVLVDDVDSVLTEKQSLTVLKAACETRPIRTISWDI